jgi:hypothetical protein
MARVTTMSILRAWAQEYAIPFNAVAELERRMGLAGQKEFVENDAPAGSESRMQSQIMLEASQKGMRLFRNNVGVLFDATGRPVRYGLANTSKQLNQVIKSADLIGWESILVSPQMVGTRIGRFLSVECKEEGWQYSGDAHELAQAAWANLVIAGGGRAFFANGPGYL